MADNNYQGYPAYTPLEVAPPTATPINYNNQGSGYVGAKAYYRTPLSTFHCTACPVGVFAVLLFGTVFIYLLVSGEDKTFGVVGLIFITIWGLGFIGASGLGILCVSIRTDPYIKEITIKNVKMCCCFSTKKVFPYSNVQKIIIKKDTSHSYQINNNHYYSFKMEILLATNEVVDVFSGVIDKDNEGRKVCGILRECLPSNIIVENDLYI